MLNSTQLSMKFKLLIILNENAEDKDFLAFKRSDGVIIRLINAKMPTMVGILTFMSMMNFKLS